MSRLLDIVAADVALEQLDDEFRGDCPFCSEKKPSFYVVPVKGFFHCFGCGTHGDAITFVMRQRKLNFIDAVEFIGAVWL
jgi:DNA primase